MVEQLKKWIEESDNIVFFGGAGVSTESGIPDFRSSSGLYSHSPEYLLSRTYFDTNTQEFYQFYRDKIIHREARPNTTHYALARLEKEGKLKAVITQNIDGLHQDAGSKNVIELHGGIRDNYCMRCGEYHNLDYILETTDIPRCRRCSGIVKPKVTLYEENLDMEQMERAVKYIREADVLIIGGTSLVVQPAAGLIEYYRGNRLVLINRGETPYNNRVNLIIEESLGKVFEEVLS